MRASQGSCCCFRNFQEKTPVTLGRFIQITWKGLSINKRASSLCAYEELDIFPITHRAWSMAIKYWLRITTGTQNMLLNEAYKTVIHEKHNWMQCIQVLLNSHGFGDAGLNPFTARSSFHKLFTTRLDDQFKQERRSNLLSSSRFDTLKYFIEDHRQESYIYKIRKPSIRKISTRLRIDMNVLWTCRINKNIYTSLPAVFQRAGVCLHFVLKCLVYDKQSNLFLLAKLFRVHDLSR